MQNIFSEIREERIRQDQQWGGAAHDDEHTMRDWDGFIDYQLDRATGEQQRGHPEWRERFVKIAALAVAAIESIDRKSKP